MVVGLGCVVVVVGLGWVVVVVDRGLVVEVVGLGFTVVVVDLPGVVVVVVVARRALAGRQIFIPACIGVRAVAPLTRRRALRLVLALRAMAIHESPGRTRYEALRQEGREASVGRAADGRRSALVVVVARRVVGASVVVVVRLVGTTTLATAFLTVVFLAALGATVLRAAVFAAARGATTWAATSACCEADSSTAASVDTVVASVDDVELAATGAAGARGLMAAPLSLPPPDRDTTPISAMARIPATAPVRRRRNWAAVGCDGLTR